MRGVWLKSTTSCALPPIFYINSHILSYIERERKNERGKEKKGGKKRGKKKERAAGKKKSDQKKTKMRGRERKKGGHRTHHQQPKNTPRTTHTPAQNSGGSVFLRSLFFFSIPSFLNFISFFSLL